MKLLTLNFLQCPSKACKLSRDAFPLQPEECILVTSEIPFNPLLLRNIVGRLDWDALVGSCAALGFTLPTTAPTIEELDADISAFDPSPSHDPASTSSTDPANTNDQDITMEAAGAGGTAEKKGNLTKELWSILLETRIEEGKLRCRSCGHEYRVKEGIGGFLLPGHMV